MEHETESWVEGSQLQFLKLKRRGFRATFFFPICNGFSRSSLRRMTCWYPWYGVWCIENDHNTHISKWCSICLFSLFARTPPTLPTRTPKYGSPRYKWQECTVGDRDISRQLHGISQGDFRPTQRNPETPEQRPENKHTLPRFAIAQGICTTAKTVLDIRSLTIRSSIQQHVIFPPADPKGLSHLMYVHGWNQ